MATTEEVRRRFLRFGYRVLQIAAFEFVASILSLMGIVSSRGS